MLVFVGVVFGIPAFIAFLLLPCGLVCFSANVIQYGMDQLHDAPMEDSVLYIHWYVWTTFAGLLPRTGNRIKQYWEYLSYNIQC